MNPKAETLTAPGGASVQVAEVDPNHWFAEALDAVAGLGRTLASEMQQGGTPVEVFTVSRPAIRRLADFETLAFLSVSEDGLDFNLESVDPPDLLDSVQREIDHQVAEGTFGWAIYQNRPVLVPGKHLGEWILLHVLATPRKVMGMLAGSLAGEHVFLPDICQKALSILLLNSASVMESGLLYKELDAHNRNLEAKIEARTRELRHSEGVALAASRAKSDFLANMSHEIRTPINGIVGMNSLMLEGQLTGEQAEQAETIQRSADSLLAIINDILDFSKIEAGRLNLESVAYDLKVVVEDVAELLSTRAAEKGLELATTYDGSAPRLVQGDPGRMRQILTNLVGNAVKFTDAGQIVIEVEWTTGGPEADHFVVSVHDTGIGISPEKLDRVFEKFTQADTSTTRMYGGTGLGLSISRELTRMMGGALSARSEPGEGSTFWFTLPATPAAESGGSSQDPSLANRSFLVIAPNEHVASAVREPLARCGARVAVVASPEELESAGIGDLTAFDAVFVDFGLPRSALAELTWLFDGDGGAGKTDLVLLVPVTQRQEALALLQRGYHHLLLKPVRERRLLGLVTGESQAESHGPADAAGENTSRASEEVGSRGRILLAEDDPVNRAVAISMLNRLGCEVVVAVNGAEAVSTVEDAPAGHFDLVLMDCQMPIMDGYEATHRLRALETPEGTRLPILALTASALHGDRERGIEAGMDDYLTKPIKVSDVRGILARWLPEERVTGAVDPSNGLATGEPTSESPPPAEKQVDLVDEEDPPGPVLDLEGALRQVGEDRDLLVTVAEIFVEGWPELDQRLKGGLAAADADELYQVVHRLKGGAGNVGAQAVYGLATTLEAAWKSGDLTDAEEGLARLRGHVRAYTETFAQLREEWGA